MSRSNPLLLLLLLAGCETAQTSLAPEHPAAEPSPPTTAPPDAAPAIAVPAPAPATIDQPTPKAQPEWLKPQSRAAPKWKGVRERPRVVPRDAGDPK